MGGDRGKDQDVGKYDFFWLCAALLREKLGNVMWRKILVFK